MNHWSAEAFELAMILDIESVAINVACAPRPLGFVFAEWKEGRAEDAAGLN